MFCHAETVYWRAHHSLLTAGGIPTTTWQLSMRSVFNTILYSTDNVVDYAINRRQHN
jgi:hypothetical protein